MALKLVPFSTMKKLVNVVLVPTLMFRIAIPLGKSVMLICILCKSFLVVPYFLNTESGMILTVALVCTNTLPN